MTASPQRARRPADPELPALLPGLLLADPGVDQPGGAARRSPRDWIVDVFCFVLAIGIGLVGYDEAETYHSELSGLLDLVVGAVTCLLLWWRRRWPVELAVVTAVTSVFASSSGGAAVILLFTVAVHRRFPVTAAVAAIHLAAGVLYYRLYPAPDLSWQGSAAFSVAFVVAITAWGMFVRARRQLVLSLRERAQQAEAEAALRVERARHLERERIAREMHDVLAHRISLLSVHAGALEYRPDMPREDVARAATVIRASAHQALQDLREVIGVLRTPSDDDPDHPQPTLDELTTLVQESRAAGMRATLLDQRDDGTEPPPAVARCAYRVVQEGLTNARKHAAGASVRVVVTGRAGDGLDVEVTNPRPVRAAGHEPIPGAGTGLVGLGERVGLAGGRLDHGWTRDGDFRVHAWLPWPA